MTTEIPVVTPGAPVEYTCPGEDHSISRSVHLSRLAAFFPACRNCLHCDDTGGLAEQTVDRLARTRRRVARPTLFTSEGVRGIHRNELTRVDADRLVAALAWLCWQDQPRSLPAGDGPHVGPVVVVGHDARPAARDLVAGVLAALVRSGCRALEIGRVSDPCFRFAVDHLQADAGVRVTGAGCGQAWTGLDAVAAQGQPLSRGGLERWETRTREGHSRPTRQAGQRRSFQATGVYEANLKRHFSPTRPLSICLAVPSGAQADTLERLFSGLPWTLEQVEGPDQTLAERVTKRTIARGADLGLVCYDDGARVRACDETGTPVTDQALATLLATRLLAEHPGRPVILNRGHAGESDSMIRRLGGRPRQAAGDSRSETWQAMYDHDAILGLGSEGTIWFRETVPTCDALLVIGHLLQTIDRQDQPLSQLIARSH
ncbi:MAG: hypothetical protein CMJ65_02755 [Planctomycetaceae bacterium]|nr:hypothetical protein [Planctomycetaceae bacterium]